VDSRHGDERKRYEGSTKILFVLQGKLGLVAKHIMLISITMLISFQEKNPSEDSLL